jgi:hypothetical protein
MHTEPRSPLHTAPQDHGAAGDFQWLPASRTRRVLVWLALGAFMAFTFNAYLHPDMVFDLANMVFCG